MASGGRKSRKDIGDVGVVGDAVDVWDDLVGLLGISLIGSSSRSESQGGWLGQGEQLSYPAWFSLWAVRRG